MGRPSAFALMLQPRNTAVILSPLSVHVHASNCLFFRLRLFILVTSSIKEKKKEDKLFRWMCESVSLLSWISLW